MLRARAARLLLLLALVAALGAVMAAVPAIRDLLPANVQLLVHVVRPGSSQALRVRADIAGRGLNGAGDGRIDALDLAAWLAAYRGGGHGRADLNDDGRVDVADLSLLLAQLGRSVEE